MGNGTAVSVRRWPISAYLMALVGLIGAVALAGVEYAHVKDRSSAERQASSAATFAARQAATSISRSFSQVAEQVKAIAATPDLSAAAGPHCTLTFGASPPFSSGVIDLVRANGKVACTSLGRARQTNYAGSSWLDAPPGRVFLYGPLTDRATGRLAMVDAETVRGFGAVAVFVDLKGLAPGLADLFGGRQHLAFLVTTASDQESLSSSLQPGRWTGRSVATTFGAAPPKGSTRPDVDGVMRVFGQAAVAGPGWRVWAGATRSQVLRAADRLFDQEVLIIAVGLLVVCLIAWIGDAAVAGPVRKLARAVTARAGRADGATGTGLDLAALDVGGPSEVRALAEGFKDLVTTVESELTQRRQAEKTARAAEESYRHLFSRNPVPMWVYDKQTLRFLAVNDAAVALYGFSRSDFLTMSVRRIQSPENLFLLQGALTDVPSLAQSGPWHHVTKDGSVLEVEINAHDVLFEGRPARFVMAENVGQRNEYERQLRDLALRDQLTGLVNRTVVVDRLERAINGRRPGGKVGVLVCNLDRFKDIINVHGQLAADLLLKETAQRLKKVAGPCGTVGRLGADEFALVCDNLTSETEPIAVASRIEGELAAPFVIDGKEVFLSASTGIVLIDRDRPADEVVRDAIYAMHRAKEAGGSGYEIFDEARRRGTVARIRLAGALRGAAERGELRLYYQPEIDLVTGRCTGAEALMRWDHPSEGLLSPAQFIPLAEETSSILNLGTWALHEACRQASAWAQDGSGPPQVSVNLSARQLAMPDLVSQVTEALDQSNLDPASICLEITETALMTDAESALATLSVLHDLGVELSIDDFGTGYSSLLYLHRYPVHYLKIDRVFVAGLGAAEHDNAIASGIIDLGHAFSVKVVAEGVETGSQLSLLRGMTCDLAQGYLWSRPVPPEELTDLLTSAVPGDIRL